MTAFMRALWRFFDHLASLHRVQYYNMKGEVMLYVCSSLTLCGISLIIAMPRMSHCFGADSIISH